MNFLLNLFHKRKLLLNLIKSDFKNRYLGNHLGIVWAFVQPLVMVTVYWFVFTYGLRVGAVDTSVPFIVWLLAGLVPWFLLNDSITSASRAIIDQAFLVKKIVFEVKLLPIVKIGSAFLVNIFFWLFLIVCLLLNGFYPNLMWLQVFYYILCILVLTLSLGLLLAPITVFVQDVGQFVSITMQIMFWVTPLFWNQKILPERFSWIIKINPFAYIVNGVRDSLIHPQPFWVHYNQTIYFWTLNIVLLIMGNRIFNKLRPHFADVL
jgi:ABC-type polysaccharide/polyol phosphate export permease